MDIAIVGVGNVGGALASAWHGAGHRIRLGVRDPGDPKHKAIVAAANATALSPPDATASADVVVLSLPWRVAEAAVRSLGNLRGKIVIDCMNPLAMRDGVLGLAMGFDTSGGEMVARWLPEARVVKTLNQVGAETMAAARRFPHPPAMLMAGDESAAKDVVAGLLTDIGFEPMDAGGIRNARLLEPFGLAWITLARSGRGRDWAFAAVSPA